MFKLSKNNGFTLVEIIIALGLIGAASVGTMSIMKQLNKGQATSEAKVEEIELRRMMATNLTDKQACKNTFMGTRIGENINSIKNSGNNVLFEAGKVYGNGSIKLESLKIVDKGTIASDGTKDASLVIAFKKNKKILSAQDKTVEIFMR